MKFAPLSSLFCLLLPAAVLTLTAEAQSIYATPYYFSHLAGTIGGPGYADGIGSAAQFNYPSGVAVDVSGNTYVADYSNHTIRKITSTGVVTTIAGSPGLTGSTDGTGSAARFNYPTGVAVDATGTVFVADTFNCTIRKITSAGVVTTVAGSPGKPGSTDGSGSAALFNYPKGVAVDAAGTVYVADFDNQTIRKITAEGVVTTLAGSTGIHGSTDGTGNAALFNYPKGVAVDAAGTVFVADSGNQTIRKITATGVVTTLAGSSGIPGSTDGTGSAALFDDPSGVAVDASGNTYVTDHLDCTIRKITLTGVVTTIAGSPGSLGSTDGTGSAAQFSNPSSVAVDRGGNIYVADSFNDTIRKITSTGVVTTIAGSPGSLGSTDGTGNAAQFDHPWGVTVDAAGNAYVADYVEQTIRKITSTGVVTTIAGSPGIHGSTDGIASAARFDSPTSVAADAAGNTYVADTFNCTIRKITSAGVVTTVAGSPGSSGSTDGTGSAALFNYPTGVAVDAAGTVFVADSANGTIRKITSTGVVTTIAGSPGNFGSADGIGGVARFVNPSGIAVDSVDNVYVADDAECTIRKISPTGNVTTLAGSAGFVGSTDGTGGAALFHYPTGVAVDAAGTIFVADSGAQTIRKITSAGLVTTLAGFEGSNGSTDGTGSAVRFNSPVGIAVDVVGNIYVADYDNGAIRKGQLAGPPVISTQPLSQTVAPGNSVQFSVAAGGAPNPTYQWYFNGRAFSGATGSTLSIANLRSSDAGDYTVIVANSLGSVTSSKATLTISSAATPPPVPSGSGGGGAIEAWFVFALIGLYLTSWLVHHNRITLRHDET